MFSTLLFICSHIFIIVIIQSIPVTHTAHIPESIILRLKDKNKNSTKSTTVNKLIDEEPRLDEILMFDVSGWRVNRQKRSNRRPQGKNTENTINRNRHSKRKAKRGKRTKQYNEKEITEYKLKLENVTSNTSGTFYEHVPLNQPIATEWLPNASCIERRSHNEQLDYNTYPLCTICTTKTVFPEGTIPNEIYETICLPSKNEDDTPNSCLKGSGQCKQRTKRIWLRRLKRGPRPTHVYESEIEQDEWEHAHYDWRYSCDCQLTPGTRFYELQ